MRIWCGLVGMIGLGVATAAAADSVPKVYTMPKPLPYILSMVTPNWIVFNNNVGHKAFITLKNATYVDFLSGAVSVKKLSGGSVGIVELVVAPITTPDKQHDIQCTVKGTASIEFRTTHLVAGKWTNATKVVPVVNGIAELYATIGDEYYIVALTSPEPGKGPTDAWGFQSCYISKA